MGNQCIDFDEATFIKEKRKSLAGGELRLVSHGHEQLIYLALLMLPYNTLFASSENSSFFLVNNGGFCIKILFHSANAIEIEHTLELSVDA